MIPLTGRSQAKQKTIDWNSLPWETTSNQELARQLGKALTTVRYHRPANIKSPGNRKLVVDYAELPWDTCNNLQLVKMTGLPPSTIRRNRPADKPSPWKKEGCRTGLTRRPRTRSEPSLKSQRLALIKKKIEPPKRKGRPPKEVVEMDDEKLTLVQSPFLMDDYIGWEVSEFDVKELFRP